VRDLGFSMNTKQELTKKKARERKRRRNNNRKNTMKEIRDPNLDSKKEEQWRKQ
jgi:hypothetical protein